MVGMIAKMKIGEKGQVVIPKIFRDNFNINTGDIVIFRDSEDYIEIRKNKQSLADTARKIASKSNQNNKQTPKELKKDYESYLFERGK